MHRPVLAESRPVVILGMHRSGTSVVAQIVNALGAYAGQPDELPPPDMFNPTGYWEHRDVVQLDAEILAALGTSWKDVVNADIGRLPEDQRSAYVARAKSIVQSIVQASGGRGPFLLKDPRLSTLIPFWREVLENPVFVIAWRDPMAVAQSLATRDKEPLLRSLAAWEHHNRTLLRDTEGLPRLLVSYAELLSDPDRVTQELHAALTSLGIEGLSAPSKERMGQIVNADFNRSGPRAEADQSLLDSSQRALLDGLRSGAVLTETVAPTSARTLALLAEFRLRDEMADREIELRRQVDGMYRQVEEMLRQHATNSVEADEMRRRLAELEQRELEQREEMRRRLAELEQRELEQREEMRRRLAEQEQHNESQTDEIRRQLAERDQLLDAVFESHSWRIGHALTGLLRLLRRSDAVSAADRWQKMKHR